jgi:hypothetical protein
MLLDGFDDDPNGAVGDTYDGRPCSYLAMTISGPYAGDPATLPTDLIAHYRRLLNTPADDS